MKHLYMKLLEEQKKLRELEQQLSLQKSLVEELKQKTLTEMEVIGTNTFNNDYGTLSVVKTEVPNVTDWPALYDHILKSGSFDLLQRRITSSAWRDRVMEGLEVPGVEPFEKTTLRVTIK